MAIEKFCRQLNSIMVYCHYDDFSEKRSLIKSQLLDGASQSVHCTISNTG